jgi:hypothetical protein
MDAHARPTLRPTDDELLVELTEALHEQLRTQRAFGLMAEPVASYSARILADGVLVSLRARGRLQWRPTGTCTACGHVAERASKVDWSCGDFCCRCTREGGCKVEVPAT